MPNGAAVTGLAWSNSAAPSGSEAFPPGMSLSFGSPPHVETFSTRSRRRAPPAARGPRAVGRLTLRASLAALAAVLAPAPSALPAAHHMAKPPHPPLARGDKQARRRHPVSGRRILVMVGTSPAPRPRCDAARTCPRQGRLRRRMRWPAAPLDPTSTALKFSKRRGAGEERCHPTTTVRQSCSGANLGANDDASRRTTADARTREALNARSARTFADP